jgi:hypothetical protein
MADEKDESTIVMPKGYEDGVLQHPHYSTRSEAVVSCRVDVLEPQKKVGTKVVCDKCGKTFDLVEAKA